MDGCHKMPLFACLRALIVWNNAAMTSVRTAEQLDGKKNE